MCWECLALAGLGGSGEDRNRAVWLAVGHEGVVRGMPTATTPAVFSQLIISTARWFFRGGQSKDGEVAADWATGGDLEGGQESAWRCMARFKTL